MKSFLIVLFVSLTCLTATANAAWLKEPGAMYTKVSGSTFTATGTFGLDGTLNENPSLVYSNQSVSLYAISGVLPGVALGLSAPFVLAKHESRDGTELTRSSLGDLDVFGQFQLHTGRLPLSLQLVGRIPAYEGVLTDVTRQSGWVSTELPQLSEFFPGIGSGSTDFTTSILAGWSFWPIPAWATAELGVRVRSLGFGPSVDYALGGGYFVWPNRLALTATINGWQRLRDENRSPTSTLVQIGGGVIAPIAYGFSLEAGASTVPWGRFASRGYGFNAGLSWDGRITRP